MMKALTSLVAVGGLLVASLPAAVAEPAGSNSASGFAPGQLFISNGKLPPTGSTAPGASGFAPGQEFLSINKQNTGPGASGFAPGKRKQVSPN